MVKNIKEGVVLVVLLLSILCILNIKAINAINDDNSQMDDSVTNYAAADHSDDYPKIEKSLDERFDDNDSVNVIIIFDDQNDGKTATTHTQSNVASKNTAVNTEAVVDSIDGFDKDSKLGIINGYS